MTDPAELLTPRVLIVDDERQIHASLRLRIGGQCELVSAHDARAALGVEPTHASLEALKAKPLVKHRLKAEPAAIRAFIEARAV